MAMEVRDIILKSEDVDTGGLKKKMMILEG